MFITINGQLGSGKSAVCNILKEQHGFSIFNTGRILRERANELGISVLELNEKSKEDFSLDHYIDSKTVEFAGENAGADVIFDSRMAWHFVPDAFRVHLLVRPSIAAERVFFNRVGQAEETYASKEAAMNDLIARRRSEAERYEMIYHVSMLDYGNYDLILDTSTLTPEEVAAIIMENCQRFYEDRREKTVVVSPKNVFPTTADIDPARVAACERAIRDGATPGPIRLAKAEDSLLIVEGHEWVIACIRSGIGKIAALGDIDLYDGAALDMRIVREWEALNGFTFEFYPALYR